MKSDECLNAHKNFLPYQSHIDFGTPIFKALEVMQEKEYKYLAFISYSRADNEQEGRKWADWIKAAIEGFSIPLNCLTPETAESGRGKMRREVFLDRSRLTAGGELKQQLVRHLQQSQFLVLLCSPKSAASEFVGFEIDTFKNAGRTDRIIPVVIDGQDAARDLRENWIPKNLYDSIQVISDEENPLNHEGEALIYADFRSKVKLPNGTLLVEPGWTDPSSYEKSLAQQNLYAAPELARRSAAYRQVHSVAKYAMLGAVFELEPYQLSGEALLEEVERKYQSLCDNRKRLALLAAVTLVTTGMAVLAWSSYRVAERERAKSERSLQLIGDAHENASRLVADVLVDLRSKLAPDGQAEAIESARLIVQEHFTDTELPGDDDDSLHMRSVVLNSRGYLEPVPETGNLGLS